MIDLSLNCCPLPSCSTYRPSKGEGDPGNLSECHHCSCGRGQGRGQPHLLVTSCLLIFFVLFTIYETHQDVMNFNILLRGGFRQVTRPCAARTAVFLGFLTRKKWRCAPLTPPPPPIVENKYDARAWDRTQAPNDVIVWERIK